MRSARALKAGLVLAAGASVAVATGSVGAAATATGTCPPAGTHVLARGRLVRVYSSAPNSSQGAVEACLVGRPGHMTLLGARRPGQLGGRSLTVGSTAGGLVAYLLTSFGVDTGSTSLLIADVGRRRVVRELPGVGRYIDAGIAGSVRVVKLALGPDATVAWITATRGPGGTSAPGHATPSYAVHAAARSGAARILDEGLDISPTTLVLAGHRLTWSHGGVERSATLP